ncbi:MAG: hypothetical protein WCV79_02715 [Candidatus Paceibacterota bacterium]|jgi:hypothetical protein
MSLLSHIENLRSKPEHVRKAVAFWYSFGFTAIIFMFWLGSFTSLGTATKGTISDAVDHVGTPAESLVATAGSAYEGIKDLFFGPKEIKYAPVDAIPGKR